MIQWKRRLSVLLVSLTALTSEAADSVRLTWRRASGAEGCLDDKALAAKVEESLGREIFVDAGEAIVVRGVASPQVDRPGFVTRLELEDSAGAPLGQRELYDQDPTCSGLGESVALVLALTLRSQLEVEAAAEAQRWHLGAALEALGTLGLFPGPNAAVQVTVRVRPPRFVPLEAELGLWLHKRALNGSEGAQFGAWHLGLAVAPTLVSYRRLSLELRLGLRALQWRVLGVGLEVTREVVGWQPEVNGALRLSVRLGSVFGLFASAGAAVPLWRRQFIYSVDGIEVLVHQVAPVVGQASVGIAVQFQ